MKDCEVVDRFVDHLRGAGYPDLVITERPDKTNRTTEDIDALAPPFAIEHTSIDALPNQREHDAQLFEVVDGLAVKHRPQIGFRLVVGFRYQAVRRGQDWPKIRSALDNWLADVAPTLPDGPQWIDDIPEIPFPFHIIKRSGTEPALVFSRFDPNDQTFVCRLQELMQRKAAKLARYSGKYRTVLLIENDDFSMMNSLVMGEAIEQVVSRSRDSYADEIWFADTSIPEDCGFWKKFDVATD